MQMADCIFCAILPEKSLVYRNSSRKIRFTMSQVRQFVFGNEKCEVILERAYFQHNFDM